MKIFLNIFQNSQIGIIKTEIIEIKSNKILGIELKNIIYEIFNIPQYLQRLSYKLLNKQYIIITNYFPLYFYYINENSTIYIEIMQEFNKNEEIKKKISSKNTKLKYLNELGYYNNNNEIINNDNNNEFNNDNDMKNSKANSKKKTLSNISESELENCNEEEEENNIIKETPLDHLINSIKANNYNKFISIIKKNNINSIDNLEKNGWNLIHYSCYYGNDLITNYLVYTSNCDINLKNKDGWTPLHLAVLKHHEECVRILLSNNKLNVNSIVDNVGTALHLACKINNLKIVCLLLLKSDLNIKDQNNKLAIENTNDKNITKIIQKYLKYKNINFNNVNNNNNVKNIEEINNDININNNNNNINENNINNNENNNNNNNENKNNNNDTSNDIKKYPFLSNLTNIPLKPYVFHGQVEKKGRLLKLKYRSRFMEIDPFEGLIRRYKTFEDYPNKTNEVIPINQIKYCKKLTTTENDFYFAIYFKDEEKYKVHNEYCCDKWIENINKSIEYCKFWDEIKKKNSNKFDDLINEYLKSQKSDIMNIDINSGDINHYDINKNPIRVIKNPNLNKITNNNNNNNENENDLNDLIGNENIKENKKKGIDFNSFDVIDLLHSGIFGKVFKVYYKNDKKFYLMKVYNKEYLNKINKLNDLISLYNNILKEVKFSFIFNLYYFFQNDENLFFVVDFCSGGNLDFYLKLKLFEENEAKFFVAELILAIEYLHNLNVIYNDLKIENIFIDENNHIKLSEIGLIKDININNNNNNIENKNKNKKNKIKEKENFIEEKKEENNNNNNNNNINININNNNNNNNKNEIFYLSSQILLNNQTIDKKSNLFNIGSILYELIIGISPFYVTDINNNVIEHKLILPEFLSPELKDLLMKLLNEDVNKRIGVKNLNEIKEHPFFNNIDWDKICNKNIESPLNLIKIKMDFEKKISFKYKNKNYIENNNFNFNFIRTSSTNENEEK